MLLLLALPAFAGSPGLAQAPLADAWRQYHAVGLAFTVSGLAGPAVLGVIPVVTSGPCDLACTSGLLMLGIPVGGVTAVSDVGAGVNATLGRRKLAEYGVRVSPVPVVSFWSTLGAGAGLIATGLAMDAGDPNSGETVWQCGLVMVGVSGLVGMVAGGVNDRAAHQYIAGHPR